MPLLTTGAGRFGAGGGGSSYVGPNDAVPGMAHFYGLYANKAGYTGPSIDISDTSGVNTQTINILSTGYVDVGAISSWIGTHGTACVTYIYDQIGTMHLNHSPGGAAACGTVVLNDLGALPALNFTSSQDFDSTLFAGPAAPFTITAVAKRTSGTSLGGIFDAPGASPGLFFNGSGVIAMFGGSSVETIATGLTENAYHSIQGMFSASASTAKGAVDGVTATGLNPGVPSSGWGVGLNNASFPTAMRWMGSGVYNSDVSASFAAISAAERAVLGF